MADGKGECPAGSPENCPIERRQEDPWRHAVTDRMDAFDRRLAENTALTEAIKANTDDIVSFFEAGKGFFRVVRFVGTTAKWVTTVAAAFVVLWFMFKTGVSDALSGLKGGSGK